MKKQLCLVLAALSVLSCASGRPDVKHDVRADQRIREVESGLVEFRPDAPMAVQDSSAKRLTLADRMELYKIPGVSIAVIDGNSIAWAKGYGVLKAGSTAPVTPQSLFEAASTSKAVTAVMVLHLVQEGKLDLDENVNTYLKSWRVPESDMTKEKKVTLRLLLTHQSGLPATNFPYDDSIGVPTLVQVLKGESPAQNKPAVVEAVPGSQWNYSNLGYVVIQQILEDVCGEPFDRIAQQVVFKPLRMTSSTFVYPLKKALRDKEAMPHDEAGRACEPGMKSNAVAQGGLMTTPSDLARFAIELMRAWQGGSERVLSRETVRLMFSKELDLDPRMFGFPLGEGLGVFLRGEGSDFSFSHPGSNWPGTTSWWTGYPVLGKGVVIMANGVKGDILCLEILPAVASAYGWPASQ